MRSLLSSKVSYFILVLFFSVFFLSEFSYAQDEFGRMKYVTVFPIQAEAELNKAAEDTWWQIREKLTDSKRFLVSSKNFMLAKDVFLSRAELKPADAIILGHLLGADALITVFVRESKVSLRVYEAKNGFIVWRGDEELHPSVPVSEQLSTASKKLLYDFLSSIPYQGAVIIDTLVGKASYRDSNKLFFKADIGASSQITVGDTAQLVRLKQVGMSPAFQGGASVEVFADGLVVNVDRNIIVVEVLRHQEKIEILENNLVRVPDELRRMKEIYGNQESLGKNLGVVALVNEEAPLTEKQKDTKPLVLSLSWLGSMVLILLLAF
ncbi:MAG: hypothetical protein ABL927_04815 [Bdellovibrionales bacterium]